MPRTITKTIETETGHRLTNYSGKCACLHGHRYRWEVTIASDCLDKAGFILDFKVLKKILEDNINELDHAFLFYNEDPIVKQLGVSGTQELLKASHGGEGRIHILPFNPTSENIISWVAESLIEKLPSHVSLQRIKMYETSTSYTTWEPY